MQQRQAMLAACEMAVSRVGLRGKAVDAVLRHLRDEREADRDLCQAIESLAARFDDEYLRLEGDGEGDGERSPEVLRLFSKARAASALCIALAEDPRELHEAIYEALSGLDNPTEFIGPLVEALRR